MTREECIQKFHHQAWGIMLDVSRSEARGTERSFLEGLAMKKIDNLIGVIYDQLTPKVEPDKT